MIDLIYSNKNMKLTLLIALILVSFVVSEKPKGVVEKLYSQQGLQNHYKHIFERANTSFGKQSLGEISETSGWWWIFGQGMSIGSTYLDSYDLGEVLKVSFAYPQYIFERNKIEGTLKYRWVYRWYLIPFYHWSECKFTLGDHNVVLNYTRVGDKFDVDRTIQYTTGLPSLDCSDGDSKQSTSWGFNWLKEARSKYEKEMLPDFLSKAIDTWMDSVDDVYQTTSSATMDELTYTLGESLNIVNPDQESNLIIGYNYNIKLNSKSIVPDTKEDITTHDHTNDLTVYFYEEYFAAMMQLDKQTIPYVGIINDKNLPAKSEFRMKAQDFTYIIEGMSKYSPTSDVEADCGYTTGNATLTVDTAINVSLPIYCKLNVGRDNVLIASFQFLVTGMPEITAQGSLHLRDINYQITNFSASSQIGSKILTDYLTRRIISWAQLSNAFGGIEYFDSRFSNMINLSTVAGTNYVRVSGDFK